MPGIFKINFVLIDDLADELPAVGEMGESVIDGNASDVCIDGWLDGS